MRFDTATLDVPAQDSEDDVAGLALRLLRPGDRVHLDAEPQTELLRGRTYEELAQELGAASAWVRQAHAALIGAGLQVGEVEDPQVVIVDARAPTDAALRHLERDEVVARLTPGGPIRNVGLLLLGDPRRARRAAALLTHHLHDATVHVITPEGGPHAANLPIGALLGWPREPQRHALPFGLTDALPQLRAFLEAQQIDLLVTTVPTGIMRRAFVAMVDTLPTSLLLVPDPTSLLSLPSRLVLYDAVPHQGALHAMAVRVDAAGLVWGAGDEALVTVHAGHAGDAVQLIDGRLVAPAHGRPALALASDPEHPITSLEATTQVVSPEGPPIVVVPVDLPRGALAGLTGHRIWAVTPDLVDPEHVQRHTGASAVLHTSSLLEDGAADDVPSQAHDVLCDRAVRVLRARGYPVACSLFRVGGPGYLHLRPEALPTTDLAHRIADAWRPPAHTTLADRLRTRCDARPTTVDDLDWLTDNRAARLHLLDAIAQATRTVHLQSYIFQDDAVGRQVTRALLEAADRGVTVRVLVDSLWSGHGSFRQVNPTLEELGAHDGVDLRVFRPVGDLVDLKRRNHCKLLVTDGTLAVLPGRNIANHYYEGFDELRLTPDTPQDKVPWLDLSTALRGPIVAHAEALFFEAWTASGGRDLTPPQPDPPQDPRAWWIPHRSLADAHILDAMRLLIDEAREQITVVNTFPLQQELQLALLDKLTQGVRVRVLTGHVRPHQQDGARPFPGSAERDWMTGLIHGRFDRLVEAGADVYTFGLTSRSWHPGVGRVLPHVHAKLLTADGRYGLVGSANLDISSSYWDAEIMVMLDDPPRVGALEAWVQRCIDGSPRLDADPVTWKQQATQRAWLSQRWPSMLT